MNVVNYIFPGVALSILLLSVGCNRPGEGDVTYTTADGKKSKDITDVSKHDGKVSFEVTGGKPVPREAELLHQQARAKGEAGDYDASLALLGRAASIAPGWPYPPYDMAFTYLLKGDAEKALQKYVEADKLEPGGFFTVKTAIWSLQKEQKGDFPKGTYMAYLSLEWADPAKKREVVEGLTTKVPAFTPAWKEKAWLTEDPEERKAIIAKALTLDADPETRGMLLLNQAAILHQAGKKDEALRMVSDLATNTSSTIGTKTLAGQMQKLFKNGQAAGQSTR